MKKITIAFLLLATVSCAQQTEKNNQAAAPAENSKTQATNEQVAACNFCNVGPQEFNTRMQSQPGQVVDVRTPEEVAGGKIAGAVNCDINGAGFEEQMQKLDKTKTVYVYCAAGGRSARAMDWMKANGFASVVNLEGGFNAWSGSQMPIE